MKNLALLTFLFVLPSLVLADPVAVSVDVIAGASSFFYTFAIGPGLMIIGAGTLLFLLRGLWMFDTKMLVASAIGVIMVLAFASTIVAADIDTGLVGYWKLDEGSGFTTVDETSYGNDGTLGGNTTWVSSDVYGYAVDFDRFSGPTFQDKGMARVDLGNDTSLDLGGGELTISAWTKYQGIVESSSMVIVGKATANANNIDYWFGTYNDKANIYWGYDWEEGMNGNLVLVDDSWYHFVWTLNSTHTTLYINNSVDVSKSHSQPLGSTIGNAYIGGLLQSAGVYMNAYNGTVDEVRIYNRSLTSTDVTELYNYVTPPNYYNSTILYPINDTWLDYGYGADSIRYNTASGHVYQYAALFQYDFSEIPTEGNWEVTSANFSFHMKSFSSGSSPYNNELYSVKKTYDGLWSYESITANNRPGVMRNTSDKIADWNAQNTSLIPGTMTTSWFSNNDLSSPIDLAFHPLTQDRIHYFTEQSGTAQDPFIEIAWDCTPGDYLINTSGQYNATHDFVNETYIEGCELTFINETLTYTLDPFRVVSCGVTLSDSSQTYYLQNSIADYTGTCFTIGADNVVVDCQGYTVDGIDETTGYVFVSASGTSDAKVQNCIVTDFTYGFDGGTRLEIQNDTVNVKYGITSSGTQERVYNSTFYGENVAGAYIMSNPSSAIVGFSTFTGGYGLVDSGSGTFFNSTFSGASQSGFDQTSGTWENNTFSGFSSASRSAINLGGGTVRFNTFSGNSRGITTGGAGWTIYNNTFTGSTQAGIYMHVSAAGKTIHNNSIDKLRMYSSSGITLTDNYITSVTDYYSSVAGIYRNTFVNSVFDNTNSNGVIRDNIFLDTWSVSNSNNQIYETNDFSDYNFAGAVTGNQFIDEDYYTTQKRFYINPGFRFNYLNGSLGLNSSYNASGYIYRQIHSWTAQNMTWMENATTLTGLGIYNISGLTPGYDYDIYDNSVFDQTVTADGGGAVNFEMEIASPHVIELEEIPTYISATFNYVTVSFGSTSAGSNNNSAAASNITVNASGDYKIEASGSDLTSGIYSIPIANLLMDTNHTTPLSLSSAVVLSNSTQTIDTSIPSVFTTNYHGFWLSIPVSQRAGSYSTTLTITVSLV